MEMMVVLLIVAIIAAASAPMVTKKLSRNTGTGDSPWVFTGLNNNIAYNMNGSDASAIIGNTTYTRGENGPQFPRLVLASGNDAQHPALVFADANGNYNGQINMNATTGVVTMSNALVGQQSVAMGFGQTVGEAQNRITALGFGATAQGAYALAIGHQASATNNNAIAIGTTTARRDIQNVRAQGIESIAIGTSVTASGANSIVIGSPRLGNILGIETQDRAEATGADSIAIGTGADADDENSIAIGCNAGASGNNSISLGSGSSTSGNNSIAIGNARAEHDNSVAIGIGSSTSSANQIVLGTPNDIVYIPGKLIVGQQCFLGANLSGNDCGVAGQWGNGGVRAYIGDISGDRFDVGPARAGAGYSGAANFISDRRLKNVGYKYTAGLAELKKLDFFHYTFKKDEEKTPHVGVIAQDLQKVFPDAVTKGEDGYLRIRWEDMFYAVINAVKELDNKIAEIVQNITDINSTIEKQNQTISEQAKIIEEQNTRLEELEELKGKQTKILESQAKDIDNLIKRIEKLEAK